MRKTIALCGKQYEIESNALLPRNYRREFGRDMIRDMQILVDDYNKDHNDVNMEILENVTWLMLKAAGNDVGSSCDEWLVTLDDVMAVYFVSGEVMDLWIRGQKTTSRPKKK